MSDGAELAAQPRDEDLDRVRIAIEVLRVDVLGQLAPARRRGRDGASGTRARGTRGWSACTGCRRRVTFARARVERRPRRSAVSAATCPLARRISARSRASTSSIRNGLAT